MDTNENAVPLTDKGQAGAPLKPLTFLTTPEKFRAVRIAAAVDEKSMSEFVREAVDEKLAVREDSPAYSNAKP